MARIRAPIPCYLRLPNGRGVVVVMIASSLQLSSPVGLVGGLVLGSRSRMQGLEITLDRFY